MIISAMTAPAHALPLTDWGVIRASGADAATFLHSQLTQDFSLLDRQHARLAGYCTAKGRLLATMVGWKASDDELLLALPLELLPATLKRLSMFVLRAKCKLSDASQDLAVWGLLGTQKEVAFAAKKVIVVVEEVVDEDVIRRDPNRTLIPGLIVDAVVCEPYGAHPSYVQGYYDRDNDFYLKWDESSRDQATTEAWLEEWVYALPDRAAYLDKLGRETLARLAPGALPAEPINYGRYG